MLTNSLIIFIATAVLWLTYRLLFRNSNQFQFNRIMLLSMTVFAFALPFIHITLPQQMAESTTFTQSVPSYFMLREIAVEAQHAAPQSFDWMKLVGALYIIGVIVFLAKLAYNILKIYTIAKKNEYTEIEGIKVVETGKEHIPYSFLDHIFMPKDENDPQILRHEMSHVRHHHSLDILFIEIATAFQWFNPFMRLIKKDLQNIHEYTADRDVIDNGADKTDYMMLILQQCTAMGTSARPSATTRIANNFSFSLTKKRIKMITQRKKTRGLIFKSLLTIPVFALLLFANCNNKVNAQNSTTYSINKENFSTIALRNSKSNPQESDSQSQRFEFNGIANDTVLEMDNSYLYIKKTGNADYEISNIGKNDTIFQMCEVMPEFPGGIEGLIEFISTNVSYPEQAKDKSIEGKCFVNFIIEPDGSVSHVEILKGVAALYEKEDDKAIAQLCDDEAIRVVKSMPKWKPGMNDGKPVRASYVLPINFKLK